MTDTEKPNAAIRLLERQIADLRDGINSIPIQEKQIEDSRQSLAKSEKRLAGDKAALLELEAALGLLKAGAR